MALVCLMLGGCAAVIPLAEVEEQRQPVAAEGNAKLTDPALYAAYRQASRAASALSYISRIRMMLEEYTMHGEIPVFLSDMDILYPDVNVPREIYQVRLVEEGKRIVALLEPDGNDWISWRLELLDNFPFRNWVCELNFQLPTHALSQCDVVDTKFTKMAPSFDCTEAANISEIAICRHDRLMDADLRLAEAFRIVLNSLPRSKSDHYRQDQVDWLEIRNHACEHNRNFSDCLDKVIRQRTSELFRQLAELEHRHP